MACPALRVSPALVSPSLFGDSTKMLVQRSLADPEKLAVQAAQSGAAAGTWERLGSVCSLQEGRALALGLCSGRFSLRAFVLATSKRSFT